MSEQFSSLRTLEVDVTPLPVEDVMRAGDRRRRTRTAGGVAVVAAALVAVVGVGTQLVGREDVSAPPAGPSSGYIPTDFPIGADLPVGSQNADVRGAAEAPEPDVVARVCDQPYVLPGTPLDRLALEGTNQQYLGLRDLVVYGSTDEARAAAESARQRFEDCPREGEAGTSIATTLTDLGGAVGAVDSAWRADRVSSFDGDPMGVELWYVVQRGPAVLVVIENLDQPDELGAGRAAATRAAQDEVVRPLVEALCEVRTVC